MLEDVQGGGGMGQHVLLYLRRTRLAQTERLPLALPCPDLCVRPWGGAFWIHGELRGAASANG